MVCRSLSYLRWDQSGEGCVITCPMAEAAYYISTPTWVALRLGCICPSDPSQNQLPVADGSLVLAQRPFLDHEGLSLRAAILPQLLHLQGQGGPGGDTVTALQDITINLAVLSIPAATSSQSICVPPARMPFPYSGPGVTQPPFLN